MCDFEYDTNKSQNNLSKHGIDFDEAKLLWNDPDLVEIPANTSDEPRFVIIAFHNGKHWSAVLYPLPIRMLCSVASSDSKARRNMMTSRAINFVNPLPVDVKTSIYILNG
ncbi:BrnT family toxin [Psychromonas sp. KJ10-10]|uniref:BrnT family toxin n=1 Tax=Psychromonas sp. KJ10-10 TaxID=3391823 RepID=UPI0039B6573A